MYGYTQGYLNENIETFLIRTTKLLIFAPDAEKYMMMAHFTEKKFKQTPYFKGKKT